jgi:hypothetical protein
MSIKTKNITIAGLGLLLPLLLNACASDDDNNNDNDNGEPNSEVRYRVSLTNLTNNQPLSPVAVVLHSDGYKGWVSGAPADDGLERLAEGGDNSGLVAEANAASQVMATASGNAAIGMGASDSVELTTQSDDGLQLTVAAMLINTNDAFTGTTAYALGDMAVGDSLRLYTHVYDAGTEANTETATSLPEFAGGEGYNAARDDVDFVSIHHGVVTADDGLADSDLDESHRFNGPAGMIVVERLQ